jgi:hypothetical protein
MSLITKVLENNGVGISAGSGKGTDQAQAAGIGGGYGEAGDRERSHTGLDDGVLDSYEISESGFNHGSFSLHFMQHDLFLNSI